MIFLKNTVMLHKLWKRVYDALTDVYCLVKATPCSTVSELLAEGYFLMAIYAMLCGKIMVNEVLGVVNMTLQMFDDNHTY